MEGYPRQDQEHHQVIYHCIEIGLLVAILLVQVVAGVRRQRADARRESRLRGDLATVLRTLTKMRWP